MRRRGSIPLHYKRVFINGLRALWIVTILWCEFGVFLWSLLACRWPGRTTKPYHLSTNILLIADPQVLDGNSYPGRLKWLMLLTQYIVDFNLRKSWNAVLSRTDPDVVLFLGDMMDNGRANMEEAEYSRYHRKFRSIFRLDSLALVYYIPGNHDVGLGLGALPRLSSRPKDRYQRYFGDINRRIEISNHTLVLLDTPGLVDEAYHRHTNEAQPGRVEKGGTIEFLQNFSKQRPNGPVVLVSHIPLYRSDHSSCGPLREKGTIRQGRGQGYQNLVLQETSALILESIHPDIIFSGDDHDYCEYVHTLEDGSKVREVTVKSFSMAMGIRRPGFQLLSLSPINTTNNINSSLSVPTITDAPCFLPDQLKIYTHIYVPLAVFTMFCLIIPHHRYTHRRPSVKKTSWIGMALGSYTFQHRSNGWSSTFMSGAHREINRDDGSHEWLVTAESDLPESEEDDMHDFPGRSPHASRFDYRGPSSVHERSQLGLCISRFPYIWQTLGSRPRSWYCRVIGDLGQVAWPPIFIYLIISTWYFWR